MQEENSDFYWEIGNRVRNIRLEKHYRAEEFAEKANISTKYLYQIEGGKVNFSTEILCKLCTALDVKSGVLLGEEELDVGQKLLYELVGRLTEEEKAYIRRVILEGLKDLIKE